jgi:hypothetical protein
MTRSDVRVAARFGQCDLLAPFLETIRPVGVE